MNEEQLKEVAVLAEELGFKPRTLSTGVTFEKFTRVDKGLPLNDMCYYLLLCEIQFWLTETYDIYVEYHADFNKFAVFAGYKISLYNQYGADKLNDGFYNHFLNCETALATGILESLKLIKNENN